MMDDPFGIDNSLDKESLLKALREARDKWIRDLWKYKPQKPAIVISEEFYHIAKPYLPPEDYDE